MDVLYRPEAEIGIANCHLELAEMRDAAEPNGPIVCSKGLSELSADQHGHRRLARSIVIGGPAIQKVREER